MVAYHIPDDDELFAIIAQRKGVLEEDAEEIKYLPAEGLKFFNEKQTSRFGPAIEKLKCAWGGIEAKDLIEIAFGDNDTTGLRDDILVGMPSDDQALRLGRLNRARQMINGYRIEVVVKEVETDTITVVTSSRENVHMEEETEEVMDDGSLHRVTRPKYVSIGETRDRKTRNLVLDDLVTNVRLAVASFDRVARMIDDLGQYKDLFSRLRDVAVEIEAIAEAGTADTGKRRRRPTRKAS